jgi:hypothetical protein
MARIVLRCGFYVRFRSRFESEQRCATLCGVKGKKKKTNRKRTPPGEGERRAQRGYVPQYRESAAAIYSALERDELAWIGAADRGAFIADDLVLGLIGRVVGHQFKHSRFPKSFRLDTLLIGAQRYLAALARSWAMLRTSFPMDTVEVRFVTNDYPATTDKLTKAKGSSDMAFSVKPVRSGFSCEHDVAAGGFDGSGSCSESATRRVGNGCDDGSL